MIIRRKGEKVYPSAGVDPVRKICHRCGSNDRRYFYTYHASYSKKDVTYCMKCVNLGRSDSITPLRYDDTRRQSETAAYVLGFELSPLQQYASGRIVEAIRNHGSLLLYAVTGAGKTEMTFAGIEWARQRGLNVAFISPRIDVVREVYMRLSAAFKDSRIDLMYDGVKSVHDYHFTVCTVHQLFNFIEHYDCIIVDETDAFPLPEDPLLMQAIRRASASGATFIFMTATPSRALIREVGRENIVTLPRRYHGHDLAVPEIIWHDISKAIRHRHLPKVLKELVDGILSEDRSVLIFLPEIRMMDQLLPIMRNHYPEADSVHSGDTERSVKVERMRERALKVLLTTTILERGVTFDRLDVIVLGAEMFNMASLIQISGRVGRKVSDPVGNIWFLAHYQTRDIRRTLRMIHDFNGKDAGV